MTAIESGINICTCPHLVRILCVEGFCHFIHSIDLAGADRDLAGADHIIGKKAIKPDNRCDCKQFPHNTWCKKAKAQNKLDLYGFKDPVKP